MKELQAEATKPRYIHNNIRPSKAKSQTSSTLKNLENRPSAFIRGKEYGVFRIPKILHCYGVKIKFFSLKSVTIALDPY